MAEAIPVRGTSLSIVRLDEAKESLDDFMARHYTCHDPECTAAHVPSQTPDISVTFKEISE